jgi:AbrB family looped-hinge helix DNA binding protein
MKVGKLGQITIPKEIRNQFGLAPETEVEFHVVAGAIAKWRGYCADSFKELGYSSVDRFIEDIRGR